MFSSFEYALVETRQVWARGRRRGVVTLKSGNMVSRQHSYQAADNGKRLGAYDMCNSGEALKELLDAQ